MKKFLTAVVLIFFVISGFSQENLVNISAGYAWLNIDDSDYYKDNPDVKATGWRINGTYDFNPNEGPVAYGFSIGYINVSATYDAVGDTVADYTVSSVPFYFAPKFLFGNEKVKGFIKLAIGGESSTIKRTGTAVESNVSSFGLYAGGGAGLMFFVSEKVFINAEYEIAYGTNRYTNGGGLVQSTLFGIGVKF